MADLTRFMARLRVAVILVRMEDAKEHVSLPQVVSVCSDLMLVLPMRTEYSQMGRDSGKLEKRGTIP